MHKSKCTIVVESVNSNVAHNLHFPFLHTFSLDMGLFVFGDFLNAFLFALLIGALTCYIF